MKLHTMLVWCRTLLLAAMTVGVWRFSDVAAQGAAGTGTFTDGRDERRYRTVRIGNHTWMAENLNYNIGKSSCYNNSESKCDRYGRLYDWKAAMEACPAGWHLSTRDEWNDLVDATGGKKVAGEKLKTRSDWRKGNGTDEYGFSALPGGYHSPGDQRPISEANTYCREVVGFCGGGVDGYWWTATAKKNDDPPSAYTRTMTSYSGTKRVDEKTAYIVDYMTGGDGIRYSVRCVQNDPPARK